MNSAGLKPAALVVGAAIIAAAWFFLSPLFIDEVVDEAFEFPSPAEVERMSAAERQAAMDSAMSAAAAMPPKTVDDGMPEAGPALVLKGRFRDADAVHKGAGDAAVYALPGGENVLRFENFRVTNGPQLVVYLARHDAPENAGDVTAGFVSLGVLKGNVGNQNYALPATVDPSDYGSVVIWCELFDVLFSAAPLAPAGGA